MPSAPEGVSAPVDNFKSFEPYAVKRKVWLVDDDHALRNLLAESLPDFEAIQVEQTFGSVPQLLAALELLPHPEVLVLDNNIGRDNGVDVIEPIKALAPDIIVVMLTTFFDERLHSLAMARGASDFILKSQPLSEISRQVFEAQPATPPLAKPVKSQTTAKDTRAALREKWMLRRYIGGLHFGGPRLKAA